MHGATIKKTHYLIHIFRDGLGEPTVVENRFVTGDK